MEHSLSTDHVREPSVSPVEFDVEAPQSDPLFHLERGDLLQAQGKLAEAIASYESALVLRPGFAQAHNNLGCALIPLGRLGAAIDRYKRAIALNPDGPSAYTNLALALHY